jgi:uncharacterized protein
MCTRSFWHTVVSTTVVLPNEETFVFTGDIEFMWLRDSAAQVHPLLLPIFPSNNHHHHHHHHHHAIELEQQQPQQHHAIELEQQQPQQHNLPDTNHRVAMIALDPKLDRIVRGLILRTAMYIRHDPYANSFHIDNTHLFTDFEKNIGRHDLIATWNYEIDSACYYFRMLYYYYRESSYGGIQSTMPTTNDLHHVQQLPRHSVLLQPRVKEAEEIMIDLWIAERRHEDDVFPVGPLFDCVNCNKPYRYNELTRDGKGSPTNSSSGLLWTAHRPSDDACMYHYLIPANMFAVVALGYVSELATLAWHDPILAQRAQNLAHAVDGAIQLHGIVPHPTKPHERIYAYQVDGLGNELLMDDANVPSLLSIPYLGYTTYDPIIYQNTRDFIFSSANPTFHQGTNPLTGPIRSYGSPHTSPYMPHDVWPMALVCCYLLYYRFVLFSRCFVSLIMFAVNSMILIFFLMSLWNDFAQ